MCSFVWYSYCVIPLKIFNYLVIFVDVHCQMEEIRVASSILGKEVSQLITTRMAWSELCYKMQKPLQLYPKYWSILYISAFFNYLLIIFCMSFFLIYKNLLYIIFCHNLLLFSHFDCFRLSEGAMKFWTYFFSFMASVGSLSHFCTSCKQRHWLPISQTVFSRVFL